VMPSTQATCFQMVLQPLWMTPSSNALRACPLVCVCVRVRVYVYVCVLVCVRVDVCVCVYALFCVTFACALLCSTSAYLVCSTLMTHGTSGNTHMCVRTHTHTRTHIHTYFQHKVF
jgi:hypothetical protein